MFLKIREIDGFGWMKVFSSKILGVNINVNTTGKTVTVIDRYSLETIASWKIENSENFWAADEYMNYYYYMDYDRNIRRLDLENKNTIVLRECFLVGGIDTEGKLKLIDRKNQKVIFYDSRLRRVIEEFVMIENNTPFQITDTSIIYYYHNKRQISIVNRQKGDISNLSLEDIPVENINNNWEINNDIGVVGETLWLDITNRGLGGAILGMNVNDGKLLHFLSETYPVHGALDSYLLRFSGLLPFRLCSKYDKKRRIIFGLNEYLYWEVDITKDNPKVFTRSLKSILAPLKATLPPNHTNCGITDKYIFASTGGLGDILISQVYALNRDTFQIDWRYTFDEPSRFFPVKVDVNDTHLFVLDNGGTLHIFEKEGDV